MAYHQQRRLSSSMSTDGSTLLRPSPTSLEMPRPRKRDRRALRRAASPLFFSSSHHRIPSPLNPPVRSTSCGVGAEVGGVGVAIRACENGHNDSNSHHEHQNISPHGQRVGSSFEHSPDSRAALGELLEILAPSLRLSSTASSGRAFGGSRRLVDSAPESLNPLPPAASSQVSHPTSSLRNLPEPPPVDSDGCGAADVVRPAHSARVSSSSPASAASTSVGELHPSSSSCDFLFAFDFDPALEAAHHSASPASASPASTSTSVSPAAAAASVALASASLSSLPARGAGHRSHQCRDTLNAPRVQWYHEEETTEEQLRRPEPQPRLGSVCTLPAHQCSSAAAACSGGSAGCSGSAEPARCSVCCPDCAGSRECRLSTVACSCFGSASTDKSAADPTFAQHRAQRAHSRSPAATAMFGQLYNDEQQLSSCPHSSLSPPSFYSLVSDPVPFSPCWSTSCSSTSSSALSVSPLLLPVLFSPPVRADNPIVRNASFARLSLLEHECATSSSSSSSSSSTLSSQTHKKRACSDVDSRPVLFRQTAASANFSSARCFHRLLDTTTLLDDTYHHQHHQPQQVQQPVQHWFPRRARSRSVGM
mmetsp:Transcript_3736/g.9080  ORF Transcript_3736/g.9080 Transcript_3736/m.9080 type:complete len:593 (-) Transcript_3736:105-1883(-)|eukprot:CAMPEP_0177646486 /NCGR_PEP_ID=MMETSP0447-20121125/9798_1 /TAXON_ID=0 /ORGANISM="Stygamoeba regulata, Strain BSH-02190019" /LENGTH=592 /DNA_ID=CAMNT_0019149019 /DNA_START=196 /DNA_END=1974 /DNA_ORIENTATION=-